MKTIPGFPNSEDLTGRPFGRLHVVSYNGRPKRDHEWICQCECDPNGERQFSVLGYHLNSGHTLSCGCVQRERTAGASFIHGGTLNHRASSEYGIWSGIVARCHNKDHQAYPHYGGRGIFVCDRWRFGDGEKRAFECFIADMGYKPAKGFTIERKDNNLGYDPDNCTWDTYKSQMRNKRNNVIVEFEGRNMVIHDALDASCQGRFRYYSLIKSTGMSPQAVFDMMLSEPSRSRPSAEMLLRQKQVRVRF